MASAPVPAAADEPQPDGRLAGARYVEIVARMDGKDLGSVVVRIDRDDRASVRIHDMTGPMQQTVGRSLVEALIALSSDKYVPVERIREAGIGVDHESGEGSLTFAMSGGVAEQ